ncbi:probable ribosomal protein S11, mitochondrial [Sesamum indicum]|uniref:Probable ribosomal protein S11, mitochondrial n=1 Tax=Sesamum indicum TaxID=4182 RepID=A0A6I9UEM1_SESIN|nr:probable ribosomal protein S11, mitochondrial [Sesamum indicum]
MFQRTLFGSALRAGIYKQASRVDGSGFGRQFQAFSHITKNAEAFSGLTKNSKLEAHVESSILGNLGMKLGLVRGLENISLPCALSLRSFIHSGKQAEVEAGGASRSVDYVQGLLQERGPGLNGRTPFYQAQVESNADIVHIKLMRNNAFVTLTDSKGNKKIGVSAGKLAGKAGKLTRYSGEAAAEDIGRRVRQMKTRSVVVKVNGFTFFRRKKEAILSFKDGYSNMRGDTNPVVYIEDTTRKPHNGCRLPKKRRI